MDDRQATPSEYAEDKVGFAADDLAHDTANVAVSGTKTAVRQGRKLFQRQREKRAAEKRRKNTAPELSQGTAPERQRLPQYERTAERPPARADIERPVDTANSIVERGRAFAKNRPRSGPSGNGR